MPDVDAKQIETLNQSFSKNSEETYQQTTADECAYAKQKGADSQLVLVSPNP